MKIFDLRIWTLSLVALALSGCFTNASIREVKSSGAPKAIGPYSQALAYDNLVFCSGQIAINPESGQMVTGGIQAETDQIFKNIKAVLNKEGLTLKDVIKTTVFLKNLDDFSLMNSTYEKAFDGHKPARSTVEVSNLPKGALAEIECIAVRPGGR